MFWSSLQRVECQRRKVPSIAPRSNPVSVPITVVRTFILDAYTCGSYHVSSTPAYSDSASRRSMVFKGRLRRKFFIGRATATARPDFSRLQTSDTQDTGKREERNASKCGGLEEIRLFLLSGSARFRRFAGPLAVSAASARFLLVAAVTRSLRPFFPSSSSSGLRYFSRFAAVRLHTVRRINREGHGDTVGRKRVMKRSVEADTLQILKISSPLITHVESTARFFIHPSRVPLFAS